MGSICTAIRSADCAVHFGTRKSIANIIIPLTLLFGIHIYVYILVRKSTVLDTIK